MLKDEPVRLFYKLVLFRAELVTLFYEPIRLFCELVLFRAELVRLF